MIFVVTSLLLTLLTLQQSEEASQVKYTVAGIAALASITVALISAGISIFTLLMSRRNQSALQREQAELAAKNQEEIEFLRSTLSEESKDRDARRDYEYDARKRLYTEVEPIRFHLYEALEDAHHRVVSLARSARAGSLDGRASWLSGPGYYLRSTVYKLLLPVVHFRLLQRRMTFIDFSLDRGIASQYMLLRLYMRSFTDDFAAASLSPKLRYEPNNPPEEVTINDLAVFSRQGLVLGDLECIADILTAKEEEKARALEFGEFERLFADDLDDNLQELVNLFTFFSPTVKPVLARLLIIQAYFAQLIISTYRSNDDPPKLLVKLDELLANPELQSTLSWTGEESDFTFVRSYWQPRIEELKSAAFVPVAR